LSLSEHATAGKASTKFGYRGKPRFAMMPGWDVQILDEDERPVARGERGEICLRARTNPHYPLGYWNRPEDSDEVFGGVPIRGESSSSTTCPRR
jgi:acyl-coenzyme A synthetase/AMP-(fatty) acid ligase